MATRLFLFHSSAYRPWTDRDAGSVRLLPKGATVSRTAALFATTLLAAGLAGLGQPAVARDTVLHLSIQDVLNSADYAQHVGQGVSFAFGTGAAPAGAKLLGTFVANRKTNSFNKTDERACAWAMVSALEEMHARALKEGGNAVVNLISYYKRVPFVSATEYECHAGGVVAGVALQGTVAQIAH
jgi:uncharacterized protein YbjQ (UPF0145 family)